MDGMAEMGYHIMKKKLLGSLLCAAALCLLLCGTASADTMVSDDGCWRFYFSMNNEGNNLTTVEEFFPTAEGAGEYYRNAELTVPATLLSGRHSYSVQRISGDFSGAGNARKITLSEGITEIGAGAFEGMNKLAEITLPSSLSVIGNNAFRDCTSLKAVTIPAKKLTIIGSNAFTGTDGLTVTFQGSLEKWNDCAKVMYDPLLYATGSRVDTSDGASFGWCGGDAASKNQLYWSMSGSQLTIEGHGYIYSTGWNPAEVKTLTIGKYYTVGVNREQDDFPWLDQMGRLKSIEVDPDNQKLFSLAASGGSGGVLFRKAGGVADLLYCPRAYTGPVTIPDNFRNISPFAFTGCRGVTGLVPQQGNTMYDEADGCILILADMLKLCPPYRDPVVIPTEATSVDKDAFRPVYDTVGALHVLIPDFYDVAHNAATSFSGFQGSFSATIQEGVKVIPENNFLDCSGLRSVALPGTLQTISRSAFWGCTGLSSLALPDGLETIYPSAFQGCTGLRTLDIPKNVTSIGENAFADCTGLTAVYYPGTAADWAEVTGGKSVLPDTTVLCTMDNQTDYVSIDLTGLDAAAGDRVTLTDEKGTVRDVTASGRWTFWNFGAKLTLTPGAGRRINYAVGVEGEAPVTHTWSAPVTLPLDTAGGVPTVQVTFDVQDGQEAYHLFVSEKKLDNIKDAPEPLWLLKHEEKCYGNGDILLVAADGVAEMREFTLVLQSSMYGCAGGIYRADGTLIQAVSEAGAAPFTVDSDITLSLTWYDRNSRATLSYDGNGSSGSMAAQAVQDGEAVLLKNGFDGLINGVYQRFDGWRVGSETLAPGATLSDLAFDTTAYALWTPAWRVRLRSNIGQSSDIDLRIPKESASFVLPADAFTRAGYAIVGWNTKAGGTGDAYDAGTAVALTQNLTLYAQWEPAWNVNLDPNGGTGSMPVFPIAEEQSAELPACAFTRENHVFTGWNTEADGTGTALAAGDLFTPDGDCTLYAQWQQESFAINSDGSAVALVPAPWLGMEAVTEAEAGAEISLQLSDATDPAEGYYYTGEFAVNVGDSRYAYGVTEFEMPGAAVMIRALTAPREAVTADFSQGNSQTVPYMALVQLRNGDDTAAMFSFDDDWREYIDVDLSGTPDLAVTEPDFITKTDYVLTLLPGADAVGTFSSSFSFREDRYSPVTLILPAVPPAALTLPAVTAIEANAFEGDTSVTTVDVRSCTSIGEKAFMGCTGLTQIRLPKDCTIDATAFDGCGTVTVFAPAAGDTEASCESIANCVFVAEPQS